MPCYAMGCCALVSQVVLSAISALKAVGKEERSARFHDLPYSIGCSIFLKRLVGP